MSKKLFVGGLSWNTTNESLRECFERFGVVAEAKVIVDRETNRSRGFGFVTYEQPAQAEAAMQSMNGGVLDSRTIRVHEAEERRPPARDGGGPRRPNAGAPGVVGDGPARSDNGPARADAGRGAAPAGDRGFRDFGDDRKREKKGRDRRGGGAEVAGGGPGAGRGRSRDSDPWGDDYE